MLCTGSVEQHKWIGGSADEPVLSLIRARPITSSEYFRDAGFSVNHAVDVRPITTARNGSSTFQSLSIRCTNIHRFAPYFDITLAIRRYGISVGVGFHCWVLSALSELHEYHSGRQGTAHSSSCGPLFRTSGRTTMARNRVFEHDMVSK